MQPLTEEEERLNQYVHHMIGICGIDFLYHILFHGIACEETHDFLTPEQKIELDKRYQATYKDVSNQWSGVELDCKFTEVPKESFAPLHSDEASCYPWEN